MDGDNVLTDLQRLCSEAKPAPPSDMIQRDDISERHDKIGFEGTPAPAAGDFVGLRIDERVVVQIRVQDVVLTERDAGSEMFRLAVSAGTSILLTTTQVLPAGSGLSRRSGAQNSAGAQFLPLLPPWFKSQRYWDCLGGEAQTCDLSNGPLYDDRGFINGQLVGCYVRAGESCAQMDSALPP
jgi:hypothetical protein